jgi:hypothetical protein
MVAFSFTHTFRHTSNRIDRPRSPDLSYSVLKYHFATEVFYTKFNMNRMAVCLMFSVFDLVTS